MIEKEIQIRNKLGLHARAAVKFVNLANRYISRVKIIKAFSQQPLEIGRFGLGAFILASLGVDRVVSGGQTMNPSTADILAAIEDVPAESLQVGDVIVFRPPSSGEPHEPVMHRIISVAEVDGQRVLGTKGDANGSADPWELRLTGEGGKLAFVAPYAGYLLWFFQTRIAWALVVLPLTAYLCFLALRRIWASGDRREAERTQAS